MIITCVHGCGDEGQDASDDGQLATMAASEPSSADSASSSDDSMAIAPSPVAVVPSAAESMSGANDPAPSPDIVPPDPSNANPAVAGDASSMGPAVASAALYVSATGGSCSIDMSRLITLPKDSPTIGRASSVSTERDLRAMDTVQDGVDGASVACSATEGALSLSVRDAGYIFELDVALSDREGMQGRVSFAGPVTGGDEFTSQNCAVSVVRTLDGGASVLASYDCPDLAAAVSPDAACKATGYVWFTRCQ